MLFIEVSLKAVLIILGNCNPTIININPFRIYTITDHVLDDIAFNSAFLPLNLLDDNENTIPATTTASIPETLNTSSDIIYIINGVRI